jgi:transcriptional regulator with PAS, ATPase and Fis domain
MTTKRASPAEPDSDKPAPAQATSVTEPIDGGVETHVVVRRFQLEVLEGPDRGASFRSDGRTIVIGTHPSTEFTLSDPTVSRFHCEINMQERATLRDLHSRNGTEIDRVSVLEATLRDGATVKVGKTRISFRYGPEVKVSLAPILRFGMMVGRSTAMRELFVLLDKAARSDITVLLEGETGTGKDVAAHSIHQASARAAGPLVVVDCGAIPHQLLESELFGHVRGAFTGATQDRIGAFEQANGGTLFLDEIGEMSLDLQPRILRALESREIRPVGGDRSIPIDVRIIAATNRDLLKDVNQQRFRPDLFYRLAVLRVRLPALRERADDIPLLSEQMLNEDGARDTAARLLSDPEFISRLRGHSWPGNVRELRNFLGRCLALDAQPEPFDADTSPQPMVDTARPYRTERKRWLLHFERIYLQQILDAHGGNVSAAAVAAGVDRVHMHRLLSRCGLR